MSLKKNTRGRNGGRGGGSGYDFQDIYVAHQLVKMLLGDRDPIHEVLWEKKTIDKGNGLVSEQVFIDDTILHLESGKWIYTQIKESGPSGGWTIKSLLNKGVIDQFWQQWKNIDHDESELIHLQFASCGNVTPLALLNDAALRSRTVGEFMSSESSVDVINGVEEIGIHLSISPNSPELLNFLKVVHAEQLPNANELYSWTLRSLSLFGNDASNITNHLIRIVADSKHVGHEARSSHTRDSLIAKLQVNGVSTNLLAATGLIIVGSQPNESFWKLYRKELVKSLCTFRVYGLDVKTPVYADLPSLYIPLRMQPVNELNEQQVLERKERRSLIDALNDDEIPENKPEENSSSSLDLANLLLEKERFILVGTQGCGKTTTLRWLAIIAAMEGDEGARKRQQFGLPSKPMLPLFVRFRRLADRIHNHKLDSIQGRVGLVAEFLAAEFQAGIAGRVLERDQAFRIAYELLESKQTIFLFDALDEVADESMRQQLIEVVSDLVNKYPEPRIIMSSRPYALNEKEHNIALPRYTPLPFDKKSTDIFCYQWYRAVSLNLKEKLSDGEVISKARMLANESRRVPDMAESPLLLSILALVHFNRQGLPIERAKLYDYATLAILGHWDRDPARNPGDDGIPTDWAQILNLREKEIRTIIEQLARDMQISEAGGEFSAERVIESLLKGIEFNNSTRTDSYDRAKLLLKLLVERSGLIQERTANLFSFVHLGFQEYLAARWFVYNNQNSLDFLITNSGEERYSEVVRFAVGILSTLEPKQHDKLNSLILSIADRNAFLASVCILEAPEIQISEDKCEELARSTCAEAWYKYYHHTDILVKVIWSLLSRISNSDQLLLEFLVQDVHFERHKMGDELSKAILAYRPPNPISKKLFWFLRKISSIELNQEHNHWNKMDYSAISSLLLVEAGSDKISEHILALVSLLHFSNPNWNSWKLLCNLSKRAESLLRKELIDPEQKQLIKKILLETIINKENNNSNSLGAAKLLFSLGDFVNEKLAEVLLEKCRYDCDQDSDVLTWFVSLASSPNHREILIPMLLKAMTNSDIEKRNVAEKVLGKIGINSGIIPLKQNIGAVNPPHKSRTSFSTSDQLSQEIILKLSEELWLDASEHSEQIWNAASTLMEANLFNSPGLPRALIRVGLESKANRASATKYIYSLYLNQNQCASVRASLLDAIESEDDKIVTAASVLLIDFGEAIGKDRIKRFTSALLRDEDQIDEIIPRLKKLLQSKDVELVIKPLSKFLKGKIKPTTAGPIALLLAEENHLDSPNLANGLVMGFSDPIIHDQVLPFIKKMLEDYRLVADIRSALSDALESESDEISWGAIKCLWDVGMRFDPNLVSSLLQSGLNSRNKARAQEANKMIFFLLSDPTIAPSTISTISEFIQSLLEYQNKYEEAWPSAECLMTAGIFDDANLPKVIIRGGLIDKDHHDQIISLLQIGVKKNSLFSKVMEEELWNTINEDKIAWGVGRILLTVYKTKSVTEIKTLSENGKKLLRVLINNSDDNNVARELYNNIVDNEDLHYHVREMLLNLLQDEKKLISFEAARCLINKFNCINALLPMAIVLGGFSDSSKTEQAEFLLEKLKEQDNMNLPIKAALIEALLSTDNQTSFRAAIYLLDQKEENNLLISRALIKGGLNHGWDHSSKNILPKLRSLLFNSETKNFTVDALITELLSPKEYYHFNLQAALLLVCSGVDITEIIVINADKRITWEPVPFLALAALYDNIDEMIASAKRFGLNNVLKVLEGSQSKN